MCSGGARRLLLAAAVLLAAWTFLGTEILSALGWIARGSVMAWWAFGLAVAAGLLFRHWRGRLKRDGPPNTDSAGDRSLPKTRRIVRVLNALGLAAIAGVLAVTLAIAISTPPNTWDTLQYHMPRVIYWIQQGHVGHFPSGDLRMLEMPPLAEYGALHILLLSGEHRFVNLIQWAALALCAIAGSLTARELALAARPGASPRELRPAEILGALLTVTIPAAATQAVNGKNDIVVALWLSIALWVAVRVWRTRVLSWRDAALAGAAVGLAIFTKGTAYIYGLPVCALLGFAMLRARGIEGARRPGAIIVVLVVAINAPFMTRNAITLGSPISLPREKGGFPIKMEDHSPGAIASNLVRNISIHTSTPWPEVNAAQERAIAAMHEAIGQGVNAPETTLPQQTFRVMDTWHSDGNNPAPLHLLLALALVVAIAARPKWTWRSMILHAGLVPITGFVLFCVLLRWQPWHARLHIPGFVLLAPAAAVLACSAGAVMRPLVGLLAFALVWPGILTNEAKPLIGPRSIFRAGERELVFRQRSHEQGPIEEVATVLAEQRPGVIGLDLRRSPALYSVQMALMDAIPGVRFREFRPRFGVAPPDQSPADVVLSWRTHGRPFSLLDADGREYSVFAERGPVMLYRPGEPDVSGVPFVGWAADEGLFPPQRREGGPLLRWGYGGRTRLWFDSAGEPTELVLEVMPGHVPEQKLTIRLNNRVIEDLDIPGPGPFREIRRNLSPVPGRNTLSLEYAAGEPRGVPESRAVLYRRIQLVPGSKVPAKGGEEQDSPVSELGSEAGPVLEKVR